MSSYLRPCVSLPPMSPANGGWWGPSCYANLRNPEFFQTSRTPWIKLWASWRHLQPQSAWIDPASNNASLLSWRFERNPDWPAVNVTPAIYVAWLDEQIRLARGAGLRVLLTFVETPNWANQGWFNYYQRQRPSNLSQSTAPPDRSDLNSPWATMVWWLAQRYNKLGPNNARGAWVDFLEVCNEPNVQWWPQAATNPTLPQIAAQMLQVARHITAYMGNEPLIAGPALTDYLSDTSPTRTDAEEFTASLLNNLAYIDGRMAYSMHNYADVEQRRTVTSGGRLVNGVLRIRDKLKGRWPGWPYETNPDLQNPSVLITEGGAQIPHVGSLQAQSDNIAAIWQYMYDQPGPAMFTNYQFWSSSYDSGLCRVLTNGNDTTSAERPAFYRWRCLPTRHPRPGVC